MRTLRLLLPLFIFSFSIGLAQTLVLNGYSSPLADPSGRFIAVTSQNYQGIHLYELATGSMRQLTDATGSGFRFNWSNDGQYIVTRSATYEGTRRLHSVHILSVNGTETIEATQPTTDFVNLPVFSSRSSLVVIPRKETLDRFQVSSTLPESDEWFACMYRDRIGTGNTRTGEFSILNPFPNERIINVLLSPNGETILFEVVGGNLYTIKRNGTAITNLGTGSRGRWSPDSKRIVFSITTDDGHRLTGSDIFMVNPDGTDKRQITYSDEMIETDPCFSHDGKRVFFSDAVTSSIYSLSIAE